MVMCGGHFGLVHFEISRCAFAPLGNFGRTPLHFRERDLGQAKTLKEKSGLDIAPV